MQRHIIVVEDEADLADLVALHLRREGIRVTSYDNGAKAWTAIESAVPALAVIAVMLPGLDGLELCRRIRRSERLSETPILIMTARGDEADVVAGLEVGADDYVVKPFSPRVLVARVRALLRRAADSRAAAEVLRAGPIEIDTGRHEARVAGELLVLTRTEFRILQYLIKKPGRVRSRTDILSAIGDSNVLERTVDVHVASLRRKLAQAGDLLETVRGVGYRIKD
jgi:DNA-binding response OmpR family regulator